MKCWKTFCDEGKICRQQRKEEKGEGSSSKGPTSTEVLLVEVEPPCHSATKKRECASRDMYYLWDASWFSLDKVGAL